jgi:putative beta-lysine N-acetyltransferase
MSIAIEQHTELLSLGKAIDLDLHNRRIKVYPLPKECNFEKIHQALKKLADENSCDKIIYYSMPEDKGLYEEANCDYEGKIDGFFQGEDAYIYSTFLSRTRNLPIDWEQEQKVMEIVEEDDKKAQVAPLPKGYTMRSATKEDAEEMARLYGRVFETYPTPMNDPKFVSQMMDNDVHFSIIEHEGKLISACSADVFTQFNAAEMTDCATLPEHRGKGLLSQQFIHLEKKMELQGVHTLFSMTRAVSVGMNLINARHDYSYGGRLIQNSNISGRLEDMNIWVKTLQ